MRKQMAMFMVMIMVVQMLLTVPFAADTAEASENADSKPASLGTAQKPKLKPETPEETQRLIDNKPDIPRRMEYLDRGLIAVKSDDGIFISWRWLATEPVNTTYNLYRDGVKINPYPLTVTNYVDNTGTTQSTYAVAAVIDGVEQEKEEMTTGKVWDDNGWSIKLDRPAPDKNKDGKEYPYSVNDMSSSDLDGDGQLDLVVKWDARGFDNSQAGFASPTILDGYKLDGTRLWRINLGVNIRAGAHYTQFMVYDLDGDGKSEIVCKTADGTTDGAGNVIGHAKRDYRNNAGYILVGPEYLTVFNGEDGTIIDTVDYPIPRGNDINALWGDGYGNRVDRFLATIAYLDGETPSVVVCRGYYTRTTLVAYNLIDGKLVKTYEFDSRKGYPQYEGKGNHSITVADVDFDGKDEIIYGASLYDHDLTPVYAMAGVGHGDAQHTSDLVPSRPGLETFSVHEGGEYGYDMRDARTGELLWFVPAGGADVGRGVSDDIDPRYPGAESWAAGKMVSADGEFIADKPNIAQNFLIYWDGDLGREVQDSNYIAKWHPEFNKTLPLFTAKGYTSINGSKSTPCLTADLFGDWREETIYPSKDGDSIKIFTTTIPTTYRIYSLMQDPQYRMSITWQNVAYNQPPHVGFYLGYDTKEIPIPNIYMNKDGKKIVNPDLKTAKAYSIDQLNAGSFMLLMIGDEKAIINGRVLRIDSEQTGVTPIMKDGRTLVPVRFISDAFGADVQWNEAGKEIIITYGEIIIQMKLGSAQYTISGLKKELDVPAQEINGRTLIPLRAMAEALDKKVAFKDDLIYISDKEVAIDDAGFEMLINNMKNAKTPELKTPVAIVSEDMLKADRIPVVAVDASSNDGNLPKGAVDGDRETRWSGFGIGESLWVDLGEEKSIGAVAISYWKGDERVYGFSIEVSSDNETWTRVLENQESSGNTLELEKFTFKSPIKARYVKYVGNGNTVNDFNNLTEFVVLSK